MAELAELSNKKLLKRGSNGEVTEGDAATLLKGKKVVALYFSAHWCPPCRTFTPALKKFYETLGAADFEIVFVSSDQTEDGMLSYWKEDHGNWLCLPYEDQETKSQLSDRYKISGIPTLVIIKPNGTVINQGGRADVTGAGDPAEVLAKWKSA